MKNAIWGMLNETEKALLREVEPKRLNKLDEDGLAELHGRIRRARRKYTKLYRRRASEQVDKDASRKKAHQQHARTVTKAEAFEDALAIVSDKLARAARDSAEELKQERLEAARSWKSGSSDQGKKGKKGKGKVRGKKGKGGKPAHQNTKGKAKTPVSRKSVASQRSSKGRKQAARG